MIADSETSVCDDSSSYSLAVSRASRVLAAVGLYGVVAYSAEQRTREIGIRVALGAQPRAILLGVVRESVLLSLAALGLGAVAAFAATRFIASMLVRVSAADPWTYLAGAGVMMTVALLASYLPARGQRASIRSSRYASRDSCSAGLGLPSEDAGQSDPTARRVPKSTSPRDPNGPIA